MARENKPAIIFIDEVDALCGPRGEGESEASRRIKTELLVQMDGVGKDSRGVLILGATNIPWQLDAAIRRRFQRRVHISLPDVNARMKMFMLAVGSTPCSLSQADYRTLADMTDGYSGSDISIAVQDALMQPIRKIQTATHYKRVTVSSPPSSTAAAAAAASTSSSSPSSSTPAESSSPSSTPAASSSTTSKLTPCSPGDPGAIEMSWVDVDPDALLEPPLTLKDFVKAVRNARPTVSQDDLKRNAEWTQEFGSEGA